MTNCKPVRVVGRAEDSAYTSRCRVLSMSPEKETNFCVFLQRLHHGSYRPGKVSIVTVEVGWDIPLTQTKALVYCLVLPLYCSEIQRMYLSAFMRLENIQCVVCRTPVHNDMLYLWIVVILYGKNSAFQ